MKRRTAGVLQLALVGLLLSGVGMAASGTWAWFKSKRVTAAERNAHWQGVVDTMQRQAQAALAAADARTAAVEEANRLRIRGADRERETERAANAARVAAVAADRDRVRDELARAAAGGVEAADDSVVACRARADALGRVLGQALQASAQCATDAEDLAAELRRLRAAWPVSAAASGP